MHKTSFSRLLSLFVLMIFLMTPSFCAGENFIENSHKNTKMLDTTFEVLDDAVVAVDIREKKHGNRVYAGSGFVIDNDNNHIATAHHVIDKVLDHPDKHFSRVRVGKNWHIASVVWENKVADIAVLKLDKDIELASQINIAVVGARVWDKCDSVGFQRGYLGESRIFLGRKIDVEVTRVNAPMIYADSDIAAEQEKEFEIRKAEKSHLKFKDLFYITHIITETTEPILDYVLGMSGGPLLNSNGEAVGITTLYGGGEIVCTPIREIPIKYFGREN